MNSPKSTVIDLRGVMLNDIDGVYYKYAERVSKPGEYRVWREGDKIYLEVFHNEP